MTFDRFVLVPLALGHLTLVVLSFNVIHGLGYRERTTSPVRVALLVFLAAGFALIGGEAYNGSVRAVSWPVLIYAVVCVSTGAVFLPVFTAYLHLRPRPQAVEVHETEVDVVGKAGGRENLIGDGPYSWMLRLPGNESLRLRTLDCTTEMPRLPRALDGLSILHLSDIHLATSLGRAYYETVINEAASLDADLVLFTGDLIDDDSVVDWVAPLMGRLKGRLGTFAILGNHDMEHHPGTILQRLADAGIPHLEGRWATVERGGATVVLGGTCSPWGPPLPLHEAPGGDLRILLSHAPDLFYWAERAGFDLMLSGHNHGGQVRVPLVGSVFMPSIYSRRFDRGFFRRRGLTLHVSQGVAGKHPLRYGCVPEVSRLVLRAVPVGTAARPRGAIATGRGVAR